MFVFMCLVDTLKSSSHVKTFAIVNKHSERSAKEFRRKANKKLFRNDISSTCLSDNIFLCCREWRKKFFPSESVIIGKYFASSPITGFGGSLGGRKRKLIGSRRQRCWERIFDKFPRGSIPSLKDYSIACRSSFALLFCAAIM